MHPEVKGDYGFYDSINLEEGNWIGKNYLSIDKGITLLMIIITIINELALYETPSDQQAIQNSLL